MTKADHQKCLRAALKIARRCAADGEWLEASTYFRMAAHHSGVLKALRAVKR